MFKKMFLSFLFIFPVLVFAGSSQSFMNYTDDNAPLLSPKQQVKNMQKAKKAVKKNLKNNRKASVKPLLETIQEDALLEVNQTNECVIL